MTLLQMSYILEVDRCGSMNRAAQNLFLSQSALSAAIAEVERELLAHLEDKAADLARIFPDMEREEAEKRGGKKAG